MLQNTYVSIGYMLPDRYTLECQNLPIDYEERRRGRSIVRNVTMDISTHVPDGFVHLCDVDIRSSIYRWRYININQSYMFDDHNSWIYAITLDNEIVKIGETGNPLGHRTSRAQSHPLTGTKGRISRYISGDGTDQDIRESLDADLKAGKKVSFWVKKCELVGGLVNYLGQQEIVYAKIHKDMEMLYLDKINETGGLPILNKARK